LHFQKSTPRYGEFSSLSHAFYVLMVLDTMLGVINMDLKSEIIDLAKWLNVMNEAHKLFDILLH